MKEFADRLRIIQRNRRMSQAQLAKTLGIAPGTLSGYMNDKNNPQITDVARFAQILGVTIGWLCGEDKPNIADIFNNGDTSYGDVLEVTDNLVGSRYLGFNVDVEVKHGYDRDGDVMEYEEVVFTTQNPVLLDYYQVYTTMNRLVNSSGITPSMCNDLLSSKRRDLSSKRLQVGPPPYDCDDFIETDEV